MRKIESFYLIFVIALGFLGSPVNSQSVIDAFPFECENASDQEALPGHILRVGFIASTSNYGWSFFFPDQRISQSLQMVQVSENAGLIGQGEVDLNEFQMRTPPGSFVVAQLFVGDEQAEPVVTCLSRPIMLTRYVPKYYGFSNLWLDRGSFGNWLKLRKYSRWNWRDRWQNDFSDIRRKFSDFRRTHRDRYDRRDRDRDRKWRDRKDLRDRRDGDRTRRDRSNDGWRRGQEKDSEQVTLPVMPSKEVKPPIARRPIRDRVRRTNDIKDSVETGTVEPIKKVRNPIARRPASNKVRRANDAKDSVETTAVEPRKKVIRDRRAAEVQNRESIRPERTMQPKPSTSMANRQKNRGWRQSDKMPEKDSQEDSRD